MFDEKEYELEKELIEEGAKVLKQRIDKVEEIDRRLTELEERFRKHVNNLDAHKE